MAKRHRPKLEKCMWAGFGQVLTAYFVDWRNLLEEYLSSEGWEKGDVSKSPFYRLTYLYFM
jgi:hypothetical protein